MGEIALVGRSSKTDAASSGKRLIMGDRCKRPGLVTHRDALYLLAWPPYVALQRGLVVVKVSKSRTTVGIGALALMVVSSERMIGVTVRPIVVTGAWRAA